ncbi:hypothetical protein F5B19DRAFT_480992 [Rostrohypoxylon terebratum]|nr:hypothetical protein F5B19DRAFT_480992 [Rostrohypoxylon terebratum]
MSSFPSFFVFLSSFIAFSMSGRVQKSSSFLKRPKQRESRDRRADHISRFGVLGLPCSHCIHFGESFCYYLPGSSVCNHCTRKQRLNCDVVKMNSLDSLGTEYDRLQKERRDTEEALEVFLRDQQAAITKQQDETKRLLEQQHERTRELLGRIHRLRRQEEVVKGKVVKILQHEEQLDKEEEELSREEIAVMRDTTEAWQPLDGSSAVSPSFFSGMNFDLGPLSPSTAAALGVVDQGSGGESPQAGPSNASHA